MARPGDTSLVGEQATKARVLPQLARHGVIHFATHAHVSADAPQLSGVLLADGEALSVTDILGQSLIADLVVLSACDTGTGTLTDGDEVVGLTRALFAAGARQAVVSLWPATDLSACLLMRRLYAQLNQVPVSEALARASRDLANLSLPDQGKEFLALRADIAAKGAPEPVLTALAQQAAERRPAVGGPPRDLSHPRYWAPFIHLGLP